MAWESVIGLEIHVQLSTQSKIFSSSSTQFGQEQNSQASLIDLGMPGTLPVLNKEAVHKAIQFGLAIHAEIANTTIFARKNYFYPDLPKGYQISQLDRPIVGKGSVEIETPHGLKKIGVTRAHLEEDAGKSIHDLHSDKTAIDLNRAGTPLLEIVSEPDLRSATEAVAYLKQIHSLVRYLGISDGNMAEGSFRCDANVSIRPKGESKLGTRTELKNINSFKFVEKAINLEIERQIDILESGGEIVQETRLYDAVKHQTRSMRSKEEANDYRYFPDPDLLPLVIDSKEVAHIQKQLPELPKAKAERFQAQYALNDYDAKQLSNDKDCAEFFESACKNLHKSEDAKLVANWIIGDINAQLNKDELEFNQLKISAVQLSDLINRISDQSISNKIARQIFEKIWNSDEALQVNQIIENEGLKQVSDASQIEAIVTQVLANNPEQVQNYLQSDEKKRAKMLGFFVGQIMKESKGQANPQQVNQILAQQLLGK